MRARAGVPESATLDLGEFHHRVVQVKETVQLLARDAFAENYGNVSSLDILAEHLQRLADDMEKAVDR